ncbi:MAG TPA: zf-HC2 domain-containing protein [Ktedonobacterales bacterium]|nr:zf-HC2 domain-containing protein [Ktedonobacterales bacterium]
MHDDQERLTEALSAYLDDALEGAERDALERHLATCAACRAELAGLRRVGALLRALPEPTLPRSFTLPETTPARTERPGAPRAEPPWARAVQWVGGMAAALGAGLLIAGIVPPTHFGASDGASMAPADHTYSQGGAASAPATKVATPTADFSQSTGQTATPPPILTGGATPEPTETGSVPAETATPSVTTGDGGRSAGSPLAPAGATLLVGGGAALAAGTVSRRRQRRSARRR